jgi:hypothetical protein
MRMMMMMMTTVWSGGRCDDDLGGDGGAVGCPQRLGPDSTPGKAACWLIRPSHGGRGIIP